MKLTLSLKNFTPDIVLHKRSFTGGESEETFNDDPKVSRVRYMPLDDRFSFRYLSFQMETVPPDVFEIEIRLHVVSMQYEGLWELGHHGKFLLGGRYSRQLQVQLENQATSVTTTKLRFKRSPLSLDRKGYPVARTWTIEQLGKHGLPERSTSALSEALPDPEPWVDDRADYPF
jgi:hypothetical protein